MERTDNRDTGGNEQSILFVRERLEEESGTCIVWFIFIVPWQSAITLYPGIVDGNSLSLYRSALVTCYRTVYVNFLLIV